jgi:multidrug efflux pump subunit AcrA (membrane-fusion protein)
MPQCAQQLDAPGGATLSHDTGTAASQHNAPASDSNAAIVYAATDLLGLVLQSSTPDAAANELANRLRSFAGAEGVAVGLVHKHHCRAVAVAGASGVSEKSEASAAIDRALTLAAFQAGDLRVPTADLEELERILTNASACGYKLASSDGVAVGSIVFWGRAGHFDRRRAEKILGVLGEPLASTLHLLQRAAPGPAWRFVQRLCSTKRWILWTTLAVVALSAAMLAPFRVDFECAAQPLRRRFIAAPFAGKFDESLVRPGDLVAKDAILGRMDGHELRLELAAVQADYERTQKSRDVNLAGGKVAAAQIDKLELERLDQQRKLIESRLANIEIRSPVAGYVISGDMKHNEGAPLTLGQVLYEIAPLEEMIVEVSIDDDEVAQVHEGQPVSIYFDAYRGETLAGKLARIYPRSEIRDSRNVFVGEVVLEGNKLSLRPGMKGTARIDAAHRNLLFGVCQRAWHWISLNLL